jgi:hypothetical protein
MESKKKSLEELQAALALEAEALATLQLTYAEKVKQVRTNTSLPPDIQSRFLGEWETFYQQRRTAIFRQDYQQRIAEVVADVGSSANTTISSKPASVESPAAALTSATSTATPSPSTPTPLLSIPVALPNPIGISSPVLPTPPTPPTPPLLSIPLSSPPVPPVNTFEPPGEKVVDAVAPNKTVLSEDILGLNTDSWNAEEVLNYEQYNSNPVVNSNLASIDESQSLENINDEAYIEDNESIEGYAATSGFRGLTEFMDFDLKRKKK